MPEAKKSENSIMVLNTRCSYLYVFKPYEGDDGKKNFCAHLILPMTHPQLADIKALMRKVANEQWGAKTDEVLAQLTAQDRLCLHRGDVNKPGVDAYAGKLFISANNKSRPNIFDRDRRQLTDADGRPYSGCLINASIDIWAQDGGKWGRRINATLTGVQFWADDERLSGGRVAAADEFPVAADGADGPAPAQTGAGGLI
jgi:hypothetical protein